VPPVWPIDPHSLMVDSGVYQLELVPLTSIVMVTNRTVKASIFHIVRLANDKSIDQVEVDEILNRLLISRMNEGVAALHPLVNEWMDVGVITEVDWNRVRVLEFQDLLRSRNSLAKHLGDKECLKCPELAKHVRISSS
jgi:antiviral helicase SKI2